MINNFADYVDNRNQLTKSKRIKMLNLYSNVINQLVNHNLAIIPTNGKQPCIKNWQNYSKTLPNEQELQKWCKHFPKAGVTLVTGKASNINALDIDLRDSFLVDELIKIITKKHSLRYRKKGKKGMTLFFKYNGEKGKIYYQSKVGKIDIIDFLSDGNHCVLPPSLHPETQQPYVWASQDFTLFDHDFDSNELPTISIKEIYKCIGELYDNPNLKELVEIDCTIINAERKANACKKAFEQSKQTNEVVKAVMPSSVSGRNNTMVSYVGKLCRLKIPIEDAVNSALAKDKELHGSNALFEDATEYPKFKFTTPRDGAVNMVTRIYKKDAEGKQEKAETNNEVNICFDIEETKNGKVKLIPNYNRFVDYAIKNFHCYCTDGTMIYKYNNQYYYDVFSQGEIYKLIRKLSLRNSTNKQCNEFYLTLQKDAWGLDKEKIIPEKMINLSNGIYDYKQKTLLPHDPKYLFKYKLNYNFDKNIKLIYDNEFHFENIFFKILNNDILLLKQLQQIMAYILIGGTPWLHKCFVLFGGGRNGKSTILDTLKALIGDSFYSTLSMGDLSHDFKPSMLDGKIANFCDESPSGKLIDSESFKNLTAGGEFIVNMKNKAPYTARCHARFVFSCNKLPKYDEQSLAINERMIFIPFDQTFTDESAVKDIFNTYIKPQMSLIFNWAIDAIDSVYELGIPTCPANDVVKQQFLIESDSVMNWFECRIKFNWSDQIRINTDYLYQDYRNYYDDDIKRPVGKDEFSKRLKIIFKNKLIEFKKTKYKEDELIIRKIQILEKNIEGFRYREDGNRVRGYIGIEINDNLLEEFGLN